MSLKKASERVHARNRAKERYDLHYNRHVKMKLIDMIKNSQFVSGKKQSNFRTDFVVNYNGQLIRFIYNSVSKEIVTFLPLCGDEKEAGDE